MSDLSLVIDRAGGLRIVTTEGWSVEGLQAHHGANVVYQVTHTREGVRLEGRGPGMSCTLRGPRSGSSVSSPPLPRAIPSYTIDFRRLLK